MNFENAKLYIEQNYNVIEYINGHCKNVGKHANVIKNPLWKIQENGEEYLLMYCEKDTICRLCVHSYQKLLDFENNDYSGNKITWFKSLNGYIVGTNKLYIHQIITGCYGNLLYVSYSWCENTLSSQQTESRSHDQVPVHFQILVHFRVIESRDTLSEVVLFP